MKFEETNIMKKIIKKNITDKRLKTKKERGNYFYASEGYIPHNPKDSACGRAIAYKILKFEKDEIDDEDDMYMVFEFGDMYHDMIQKVFVDEKLATQVEEATIVYSDNGKCHWIQQDSNKIIITNPVEIHGRLDLKFNIGDNFLVNKGKYIADIKTISGMGWNYFDKPKETAYLQIQLYLHDLKLSTGFLLYINKSSGEMKEFKIEYDEEYVKKALQDYKDLWDIIKVRKLPPRHFESGTEVPWQCKYCSYAKTCLGKTREELKNIKYMSYSKEDLDEFLTEEETLRDETTGRMIL